MHGMMFQMKLLQTYYFLPMDVLIPVPVILIRMPMPQLMMEVVYSLIVLMIQMMIQLGKVHVMEQ